MNSTRVQRIIQFATLILLGFVFWNYSQIKKKTAALSGPQVQTSYEKAIDCHCDQDFVETPEMTVVKIFPIENSKESSYQKWILRAPTGHTLIYVNNITLCKFLDLKKDDRLRVAGEFRWSEKGGQIENNKNCKK